MASASGCRHLKVNLKAKSYIYVNSTTLRCPNKVIKIFLIEDFSHLPPVTTTPVVHLEPRIFDKFEMAVMVHSGAWGKLIQEKKVENLVALSL
jgi:hypothetical protein